MLKILESTKFTIQSAKSGAGVCGKSKAEHDDKCELDNNEISGGKVNDNKVGNNKVEKNNQKIFKFKKLSKSKKTELSFFIFKARLTFIKLR